MISQHATPPRFGTQPLGQDDLFELRERPCIDCGAAFQVSGQATRCARCASLKSGMVGPATVECPVCSAEHQVPILSPSKLCGLCRADPELCRANIAADLDRAEQAWQAAADQLNTAVELASVDDMRRFEIAVSARETGRIAGKQYSSEAIAANWAKALAAGDGLSKLLELHDALKQALAELRRAQAWAERARQAMEEATA